MKPWLVATLVLSLMASAFAERHALILISPDSAGPKVDVHNYVHDVWALWPPSTSRSGANRMLSLPTGTDWAGETGDDQFRAGIERSTFVATNGSLLAARGYFRLQNRWQSEPLLAMESPQGAVNPACLLLATTGTGEVTVLDFRSQLPDAATVVCAARSWDEARELSLRADRTIILEIPPASARWSRLWLWGRWPEGIPRFNHVPGLVTSRMLVRLLQRPSDDFTWGQGPTNWTGANRWLEFVRGTGLLVQTAIGLATMACLFLAALALSNERRSRALQVVLRLTVLSPAAILIAGATASLGGLGMWWPAFAISWALLFAVSQSFRQGEGPAKSAFVSLVSCALCIPAFSLYSEVLGHMQAPFSPQWVAVGAASTLVLAESVEMRTAKSRVLVCLLAAALILPPAIYLRQWQFVIVAGVLIGAVTPWKASLALGLASIAALPAMAVWTPGGLLNDASQLGKIDLSQHAAFLASPGFVGLCLTIMFISVFSGRYLWREVALVAWATSGRVTPLFRMAAWSFAWGVLVPPLLTSAFYILFAGLLLFADEGLRTL